MENKFENKEDLPSATETINAETLSGLIYRGESLPQDNRFLSVEEGGVFKYFNLRSVIDDMGNRFYSLVKIGEKIIGLSELENDPYKEKNLWIKFLSIDPEYQDKGYASKLAEEIFHFAKQEGFTLEGSSYNDEGYKKLKPLLNRLANELSVSFVDKGKL